MKHLVALAIKFVLTAIVLEVLLNLMTNLRFGQILWISVLVTILAYVLGDLLILPLSNNTVAMIADAILAFVVLYMYNIWADYTSIGIFDAIITALVLGVGEWFFHKFVYNTIFTDHRRKSET